MTEYTLAKTAGFCFGVNRAVDLVFRLLDEGKHPATLGPIIHNPQLVERLAGRGVRIINSPEEARPDETVVIRSHGVAQEVYGQLEALGVDYADATCPFVAKIHRIVRQESGKGKTVIVAGDVRHAEVEGIRGHCQTPSYVVEDGEELRILAENLSEKEKINAVLVAQTTYHTNRWHYCNEIAKKHYTNLKIFDTICSATSERQSEAAEMAAASDLMLVIGGRHSSNTRKLQEVCQKHCRTLLIETKDELNGIDLFAYDKIGVTAGASTPADIIKEVLKTMSEILRNEEMEDFATLLEQSLESEKIYNGKRVTGVVTSVAPNEVHVDIGAKQAGIIPAEELSDDPSTKIEDLVKKGDEIELVVVKVNDQEGIVTLSKKRCDAARGFEELKKAYEEETILDGVVTDVVRGGVLVYTCNTKIFVPASQSSDSRVEDLNTLLKKPVRLKIIEINEQRSRAKGSVRAVLSAERKEKQAKFWESVEIGKVYQGEVKSLTSYGAFVDLGGIDGMIHITELSWSKLKHPSEVVNPGDMVEVYIKDFDPEKKRISLGYKKNSENPWVIFQNDYHVDDVVKVKIVSFTAYGAFAEIIPGIDGLIHISQIANQRVEKISDVLKVGQEVDAKIIEIDVDKKRVSLSMRALLSEDEQKKDKELDLNSEVEGVVAEKIVEEAVVNAEAE